MNKLTLTQAKEMMRAAYIHSMTARLWMQSVPAGQRRIRTALFVKTNRDCASLSLDLGVDKDLFFKFIDRANKRIKV